MYIVNAGDAAWGQLLLVKHTDTHATSASCRLQLQQTIKQMAFFHFHHYKQMQHTVSLPHPKIAAVATLPSSLLSVWF